MERAAFAEVNERQELLGLKSFANPRNCAAGTLRQLDARVTKERKLSMFVFNLQRAEGHSFTSHTDAYDFMRAQGIKIIANYNVCHTADEVWNAIMAIGGRRGDLPYDIDGAVVKVNDFAQREELGATAPCITRTISIVWMCGSATRFSSTNRERSSRVSKQLSRKNVRRTPPHL